MGNEREHDKEKKNVWAKEDKMRARENWEVFGANRKWGTKSKNMLESERISKRKDKVWAKNYWKIDNEEARQGGDNKMEIRKRGMKKK